MSIQYTSLPNTVDIQQLFSQTERERCLGTHTYNVKGGVSGVNACESTGRDVCVWGGGGEGDVYVGEGDGGEGEVYVEEGDGGGGVEI